MKYELRGAPLQDAIAKAGREADRRNELTSLRLGMRSSLAASRIGSVTFEALAMNIWGMPQRARQRPRRASLGRPPGRLPRFGR
jgi:hypothetical protein